MQESQQAEVALCASSIIGLSVVNPTLRFEVIRVSPPKFRSPIDCPRADDNLGSTGDAMAGEGGVSNCNTNGYRNGRVEPQSFVAYSVQQRKPFQNS